MQNSSHVTGMNDDITYQSNTSRWEEKDHDKPPAPQVPAQEVARDETRHGCIIPWMNTPEHRVLGTNWRLTHSLGSGCIPYYTDFLFCLALSSCRQSTAEAVQSSQLLSIHLRLPYRDQDRLYSNTWIGRKDWLKTERLVYSNTWIRRRCFLKSREFEN